MKKQKLPTFKDEVIDPVTLTCFSLLMAKYLWPNDYESTFQKFTTSYTWGQAAHMLSAFYHFGKPTLLDMAATGGIFLRAGFVDYYLETVQLLAAWHHCVETLGWEVES